MGEYQSMIMGKSPLNGGSKKSKLMGEDENYKSSMEKVKIYVEDLTVMRESLLKIEFRNIELEELHASKEREVDELRKHVRDL